MQTLRFGEPRPILRYPALQATTRGIRAMSTLQRLPDRGLVKPPRWLPANVQYETVMGSVAYGVSSDSSDLDVYGWAIPPKEDVFPHLRGEGLGFGRQAKRFEQFQEHHVPHPDPLAARRRTSHLH